VHVTLGDGTLSASGVQIGVAPVPYRLDYFLHTAEDFVTRTLHIDCTGEGWRRKLLLRRTVDGAWDVSVNSEGDVDLPSPGGDAAALAPALDCDLGLSPLTNAMPVRRHALHERPGEEDFLMAWVAVPELTVHAAPQRYEHVRPGVVRYVDRGLYEGFTAELEVDAAGLAMVYPGLARRVAG
jgi:hypothetical protein